MTDHTPSGLPQPQTVAEFHNPWRTSLENCISGDNYLRAGEYRDLIADLDRLYALEQGAPAPAVETVAVQEAPYGPIDANRLEEIAKERPNERFLKGSGVLKLLGAIRQLEQENRALRASPLPVAPKAEPANRIGKYKKLISQTIGYEWEPGELQTVNADDLLRLIDALATPQAASAQPVVADTPEARMFAAAVAQLAEISDALGIDPEEAACANGNDLILAAIARKNEALLAALRKKP